MFSAKCDAEGAHLAPANLSHPEFCWLSLHSSGCIDAWTCVLTAMCLHPVSEPADRRKVLILCFLRVSASVCCGHEQQLIVFLWCQVGPPASACTVHSETTLFFVNVKGATEPHLQQEAKTQWGFCRRL